MMMSLSSICCKILATLLVIALPAIGQANYPLPGSCSGDCWTHDPAIFEGPDGSLFRFSTGRLIGIYKAASWEGPWTYEGSVIEGASIIDLKGNDDLWAPDVQFYDGTFHLYYSVSSFGSQESAIGVATSTTLESGSWTDQGATGLSSRGGDNYNAIDPNVYIESGTAVMNFGSFWADIFQTGMSDMNTASGSPINIALNTSSSTQAVEGPFMYKHADHYYLFTSSGSCCGYDLNMPAAGSEYQIMVCRSDRVSGPYVDADGTSCLAGGGTLVLQSHGTVYGPGGQGVYYDSVKGPVMYYHYVDTTVGYADGDKKFGWNVLDFSSGWPVAT